MNISTENNKKIIKSITEDIEIIKEAINNGDVEDAKTMLDEMVVDLKLLSLML